MRKLLVPIDQSENALRAVKYAIDCAGRDKETELLIVTAHEPPVVYGEIEVYVTEDEMARLQQKHSAAILEPAEELARAAGVSFTTSILIGHVAQEIVRAAENAGCDGIVMGTRGMGAIGNLFLGSVATKVVHLTQLPVTLVK